MFTISLHNLCFFAQKQQLCDKSHMFLLLTNLLLVIISEAHLMYNKMPLNTFAFFLSYLCIHPYLQTNGSCVFKLPQLTIKK